jgi:hypothetical protein
MEKDWLRGLCSREGAELDASKAATTDGGRPPEPDRDAGHQPIG